MFRSSYFSNGKKRFGFKGKLLRWNQIRQKRNRVERSWKNDERWRKEREGENWELKLPLFFSLRTKFLSLFFCPSLLGTTSVLPFPPSDPWNFFVVSKKKGSNPVPSSSLSLSLSLRFFSVFSLLLLLLFLFPLCSVLHPSILFSFLIQHSTFEIPISSFVLASCLSQSHHPISFRWKKRKREEWRE